MCTFAIESGGYIEHPVSSISWNVFLSHIWALILGFPCKGLENAFYISLHIIPHNLQLCKISVSGFLPNSPVLISNRVQKVFFWHRSAPPPHKSNQLNRLELQAMNQTLPFSPIFAPVPKDIYCNTCQMYKTYIINIAAEAKKHDWFSSFSVLYAQSDGLSLGRIQQVLVKVN